MAGPRVKRARRASNSNKTTQDAGTRLVLLKAAKKLFARRGLSGTSIRDIAQEAKLNSSLISYYFESKEGLYQACIQEIGEERLKVVQQLLRPPSTEEEFRVRLTMFLENMFELYLDDRDAGLILMREYDRMHSPAEQIFKQTFLQVFDLIVNFFKKAQKKSLIAPGKDPFTLASLLFGCLSSQMRLDHMKEKVYSRSIKNPAERRRVEEHIIDLFLGK